MILHELSALYDRLVDQPDVSEQIPLPGWSEEKVGWAIVLDAEGAVKSVLPLGIQDEKGRLKPLEVLVPDHDGRSGKSPKAYFLCDKASYLLGIDAKDGSASRERSRFLHHEVLDGCSDVGAKAVLAFFDNPKVRDAVPEDLVDELVKGRMMVFCLEREGDFIHEHAAVRSAWADYLERAPSDDVEGFCSVTGEYGTLARLFPQVTGIPGAQSSGASLVSFNFDASESYGKKQAYNAAISKSIAFKAGTALKYLLGKPDRRIVLGNTIVTFWADRAAPREERLLADILLGRSSAEDKVALDAVSNAFSEMRKGLPLSQFDNSLGFSILGVSPNAARLSVRFYEHRSLGSIAENYGYYLRDTSIVGVERTSIWGFLLQTASPGKPSNVHGREPGTEHGGRQTASHGKPSNVPSTLVSRSFESMLRGTDFPVALEQLILSRMRADHASKDRRDMGQRAAALKGCLVRRARRRGIELTRKERFDMALNRENTNIGYLLGRLFAVMERAQQGASGDTNATIRDRYIGAASSTPERVFQPLMRGCQANLGTLRKKKRGLSVKLEQEMDEIVGRLFPGEGSLPKTLGLDEQGAFFIGYYQERCDLWRGKVAEDEDVAVDNHTGDAEEER